MNPLKKGDKVYTVIKRNGKMIVETLTVEKADRERVTLDRISNFYRSESLSATELVWRSPESAVKNAMKGRKSQFRQKMKEADDLLNDIGSLAMLLDDIEKGKVEDGNAHHRPAES